MHGSTARGEESLHIPRNVSIFVSSTFLDMQRERDALRDIVLPRLRRFAEPYGVSVDFVDLRWGIDTSAADEHGQMEKILRVCRQEIDRCQPFFIALLGNRYGHVLNSHELPEGIDPCSVTELEICHAMNAESAAALFLCYVRSIHADGLASEQKAMFFGSDDDVMRLERLKERIRRKHPNDIRQYDIHLDEPSPDGYGYDLRDFCRQVTVDVTTRLKRLWGDPPTTDDDPVRISIIEQRRRIRERSEIFADRAELIEPLKWFLRGGITFGPMSLPDGTVITPETRLLLLQDDSGTGKTAVLSKLASDLSVGGKSNAVDVSAPLAVLPIFGLPFSTASSVTGMLRMLCQQLSYDDGPDVRELSDDTLILHFRGLLAETCRTRRVAIIIDDIDVMAGTLAWLGGDIPENCRILCSLSNAELSEAPQFSDDRLSALHGERCHMPLLTKEEIRAIVTTTCLNVHKELSQSVVDAIVDKSCINPANRIPEYPILLVHSLMILDGEEYRKAQRMQRQGMTPIDALNAVMISRIRNESDGIDDIYHHMMMRASRLVDDDPKLLMTVAALSSGLMLRERDIIQVFRKIGYTAADFALIRQMLPGQIVQRGHGDCAWSLASKRFAAMICDRYREEVRRVTTERIIPLMLSHVMTPHPDVFLAKRIMYCLWLLPTQEHIDSAAQLLGERYDDTVATDLFGESLAGILQADRFPDDDVSAYAQSFLHQMIQSAGKLDERGQCWFILNLDALVSVLLPFGTVGPRTLMVMERELLHILKRLPSNDVTRGLIALRYCNLARGERGRIRKEYYAKCALSYADRSDPDAMQRAGFPRIMVRSRAVQIVGDMAWNSGRTGTAARLYASRIDWLESAGGVNDQTTDYSIMRDYLQMLIRVLGIVTSSEKIPAEFRNAEFREHISAKLAGCLQRIEQLSRNADTALMLASGYFAQAKYLFAVNRYEQCANAVKPALRYLLLLDSMWSYPPSIVFPDVVALLDMMRDTPIGDRDGYKDEVNSTVRRLLVIYRKDPSVCDARGEWGMFRHFDWYEVQPSLMRQIYEFESRFVRFLANAGGYDPVSERVEIAYAQKAVFEYAIWHDRAYGTKFVGADALYKVDSGNLDEVIDSIIVRMPDR